jgi:hypothetical protein
LFWGIIVSVSVLLAFFVLYPRLLISIQNPPSPNSFIGTTLELHNDGYVPVYKIELTCNFENVDTVKHHIKFQRVYFTDKNITLKLSPGEKTTLDLKSYINLQAKAGSTVKVIIRYNPFFIPITLKKIQRYKVQKNYKGETNLFPASSS